jgi:ketosteroid isomerase-like protein
VILWQDLNFWTAVGQVAIGVMVGVIAGVVLRRLSLLAQPSVSQPQRRVCPACGTLSLQRVRGTFVQRAISTITRRWPYACTRCDWPASASPRRKAPPAAVVVSDPEPVVAKAPDPKAEVIEAKAVHVRSNLAPVQPIQAEPEPRPAPKAEPAPRRAPKAPQPAPAALKDDAALVKDSVYHYVAMLNAGDVSARASCYLSEFTTFAIDGGPLISSRFEGRNSGPIQTFDLRCRDLRVYVHKDTAIATGYLVGTITDSNNKPMRVTGRSSWVHLRQNGEWKIAHSHLSPLNPEV